jgi:hypothetical protein
MTRKLDLVGIDEIGERLGVARGTVSMWILRDWPAGRSSAKPVKPPRPVAVISRRIPVFLWRDVERWARETGRLQ